MLSGSALAALDLVGANLLVQVGALDAQQDGGARDVPPAQLEGVDDVLTLREFRERSERQYIVDTLKLSGWNISRTAILLGVERTNLHKKIRAYQIKRGEG